MEDGSGLSKLIPSLEKSALFDSKPEALVCLLRNGLEKNPETGQEMPGNILLNDVEMTNLVNYLRSIYAADPVPVKVSEVNEWLESCP